MQPTEIEDLELDLLLEGVFRRYGYDFRHYARASLERRVRQFAFAKHFSTISALLAQVIHDEALFSELAQQFSVSVTEMFRDPPVFRFLRERVLPRLASFPFVKVWAAGCATGEEVYSLAVLLDEAGLLDRCTIFGTDFNDDSLSRAKLGIYPLGRIQEFTKNYQETGAVRPFADFYVAGYDSATMVARLRERITFANHNLATDQVFGEMNLIFCRNVLIYFDRVLQDRALRLFADSLMRGGYLVLGTKEDLQFSGCAQAFDVVERGVKTFIKRGD